MTYRLIRTKGLITIERLTYPRFKARLFISNSEYRALVNGEPFYVEFNDVQWLDKTEYDALKLAGLMSDAGDYLKWNVDLLKDQ